MDRKPPMRKPSSSRAIAMIQLFFGGLLMLMEIVGLGMAVFRVDIMSYSGAGIWNGIMFMVTGVLGIRATREPIVDVNRRGLFIGFLVMSVISSIFAISMFTFSVISVSVGSNYISNCNYYYSYYCRDISSYAPAFLSLRILSCILYFALFILFIVTSAFGCCNVCHTKPRVPETHQVVYHTHVSGHPMHPYPQFNGPPTGAQGNAIYMEQSPPPYNFPTVASCQMTDRQFTAQPPLQ